MRIFKSSFQCSLYMCAVNKALGHALRIEGKKILSFRQVCKQKRKGPHGKNLHLKFGST